MKNFFNSSVLCKRLMLIAFIAPFMLLWGEVFTGILFPQNLDSKMNIYAPDPVIGFTYKPHAITYEKGREYSALYQINSLGLRDREYGPKEDGIFRVLLLGDSFTASHGLSIEESLPRQLERALQLLADLEGMSVSLQVVNGAAGGYSPYNYWKAYHRWAPILEPDVVVVALSPDDYDSSNAGLQYFIEDGATMAVFRGSRQLKKKSGVSFIRKLRKWLSYNSQFYILLRNYLYYNDLVGRVSLWLTARDKARVNQLKQFMVPQPESMSESWEKSFYYLEKLHKATTADNVTMIVIPIPLKIEIDAKEFQRALSASGLNREQTDINQPLKQVSTFSNARNIPLLDPRPSLRKRHVEVPCYFVYDGHWNAEGVRFAADELAQQWRESGLSPWEKGYRELQKGNTQIHAHRRAANEP